jgi:hypothetical protein
LRTSIAREMHRLMGRISAASLEHECDTCESPTKPRHQPRRVVAGGLHRTFKRLSCPHSCRLICCRSCC